MQPYALNNITSWCTVCANTVNTGCDVVALAATEKAQLTAANATIASLFSGSNNSVSPVGAGFIGAAVTIIVGAVLLGLGMGIGWVKVGKKDGSRSWNKRDVQDKGFALNDSASFASTANRHD